MISFTKKRKSNIHPDYLSEGANIAEIFDSKVVEVNGKSKVIKRHTIPMIFLLGMLTHGVTGVIYDLFPSKKEPQINIEAKLNETNLKIETFNRDLDVMTKIITGLVPAVKELSKNSNVTIENVSISVDKANVREQPNEDSRIMLSLARGSELVTSSKEKGFFKVSLPTGGYGWISEQVVSLN